MLARPTTETYSVLSSELSLPCPSWMHSERPAEVLPDTLRCGYKSKRCDSPRTIKKSGGLHRFCAFHRERANRNQWRVDHRRRLLKKNDTVVDHGKRRRAVAGERHDIPPRRGRSPRCSVDWQDSQAGAIAHTHRAARCLHDAEFIDASCCVDMYDVCRSREARLNEQDVAILRELLLVDDAHPQLVWSPLETPRTESMRP